MKLNFIRNKNNLIYNKIEMSNTQNKKKNETKEISIKKHIKEPYFRIVYFIHK